MSFHEKLRSVRKARGYTQQNMADLMKIDKSTYCGYETGKRQPDVQKIKQLSEILSVSGDALLETGFEPTSVNSQTPDHNANTIKIAGRDGSFVERTLTDEQVELLKAMLNQLPDVTDL